MTIPWVRRLFPPKTKRENIHAHLCHFILPTLKTLPWLNNEGSRNLCWTVLDTTVVTEGRVECARVCGWDKLISPRSFSTEHDTTDETGSDNGGEASLTRSYQFISAFFAVFVLHHYQETWPDFEWHSDIYFEDRRAIVLTFAQFNRDTSVFNQPVTRVYGMWKVGLQ